MNDIFGCFASLFFSALMAGVIYALYMVSLWACFGFMVIIMTICYIHEINEIKNNKKQNNNKKNGKTKF